jgi:hypothetical protein
MNAANATTAVRQRMRRFWDAVNDYAAALESTPCDVLLERVNRLEEEVERLKSHSMDA